MDFVLLRIISDSEPSSSFTETSSVRWMSPELLDPETQVHQRTGYSDCYALGMVIYEVLSGHKPFYQYMNFVVSGKVAKGERPERPQGLEGVLWFTDDIWEVLERCWASLPLDRPSIKDVLKCLEKAASSWTPPSLLSKTDPRNDPGFTGEQNADADADEGKSLSYLNYSLVTDL